MVKLHGTPTDENGGIQYSLKDKLDHEQRMAAMRILLNTVMPAGAAATGTLREGLKETPARAALAWADWLSGYDTDPNDLLKMFEDGAEDYDGVILIKDIPFYSHCEHHLAPFFGRVVVAYIPDKRIVGLSKINRVVNAFARRLQVQERLTRQIADALWQGLEPIGVAVQIRARHMCMESRGVRQQGHSTTTQALRGTFLNDPDARAEFIELAKSDTPL